MSFIYLDHLATTPLDPNVLEAMMPFLTDQFGNAASNHQLGRAAGHAVQEARLQIAEFLGADPLGLIFTSGATESINMALKGLASFYGEKKNHIITSQTEHPAVLDVCAYLAQKGFRITYLGVDALGHLDYEALEAAIDAQTLAISLMYANNETGVIHDCARIGQIARAHDVFYHCDGTQAVGKLPLNLAELPIDLLSFSGHKIYGPKGVGALWVRRKQPRVRLTPLFHGGGHERGFRSGTSNVPGIIGLAKACALAAEYRDSETVRLKHLGEILMSTLTEALPQLILNGDPIHRIPGCFNLRFPGLPGSILLSQVPQLAMSVGSACSSALPSPSHVLRSMGRNGTEAEQSVRLSMGRGTREADILEAATQLITAAKTLYERDDLGSLEEVCKL